MPWLEGESGTWEGGRVFVERDGSKTFHIRKAVAGVRHEFSTRCSKLGPAMKAYEKWQADNSWRPGCEYAARVLLTDALIARHLAWAEEDGPLAQEWKRKKQVYLEWWRDLLAGRDLRTVALRHLQDALEGVKARTHRKAVIKHLYTFCREKGLISRDEDPTFDLALPQAGGGMSKKERAITRDEFGRTFEKVTEEQYRDILTLQAGTGMHVSEAQRLARGQGLVGPDFVAVQHKRGTLHRQAVKPDVMTAARRIQERGSFSVSRYSKAVRKAAKAAGMRPWAPGSMRHSVTTWLLDEGATLDQVSTWLGHLSPATTKRFYARLATIPLPGTARPPLRLVANAQATS